jgi:CBS domain containing-hemolysin-like protein
MDSDYWPYISIILLIICSAFFSASEIAYASANKLRLKKAAEAGGLRAKWAQAISSHYDRALCTILLGNDLVNIAASSVATVIALSLIGEQGVFYATLIMTILILIFGEIVPKQLAIRKADALILFLSPLLRFLMVITKPLVWVVMKLLAGISRLWGGKGQESGMTNDELVTIIETVEEEGIIDEERSDLLQSALGFSEIKAREIITHRLDVIALNIADDLESIMKTAMSAPYSRFPVYEGSIDTIIGVLHINHLLKALLDTDAPSIRSLLTEVCYVHRSKTLPVVLAEMQRRKIQMAVVSDDFGGTMGILTMEDILEQIVGEIWDETDVVRDEFRKIGEDGYEVDGNMGIYDFLDHLGLSDHHFENKFITTGGWAIDMLGGFPQEGDSFTYQNLTITITEIEDLRIKKLQIHPQGGLRAPLPPPRQGTPWTP